MVNHRVIDYLLAALRDSKQEEINKLRSNHDHLTTNGGTTMTPSQEAVERIVKELFYLAHVEYRQEDAMANNPSPEEEAIKLISQELQKVEERDWEMMLGKIELDIIEDYITESLDTSDQSKWGEDYKTLNKIKTSVHNNAIRTVLQAYTSKLLKSLNKGEKCQKVNQSCLPR